jgi:hypothetical protein
MFRELETSIHKRLKQVVLDDVNEFYKAIEPGSNQPYAIPIEIPKQATSDDLRMVSHVFSSIGASLSLPLELRLSGPEPALKLAQDARQLYQSAGLGFRILSAWTLAADLLDDRRHCTICHRHSSAISRCSLHATKKQETRKARLGKRIRPLYEQRLLQLSRVPAIRRRLQQGLSWSEDPDPALVPAANAAGLTDRSRIRALVLAKQIRELVVVMNPAIKRDAGKLFRSILVVVHALENQPDPVGDQEKRFRDRQQQAMRELMSIKGFFKAWCGKGRYSAEINLTMLGFDRDHPVVKGSALDSTIVPRALLEQRAWTEASQEFKESNLPTAGTILRLTRQHQSKKKVAERLGISLATVYNILHRGRRPRKRNYFGSL